MEVRNLVFCLSPQVRQLSGISFGNGKDLNTDLPELPDPRSSQRCNAGKSRPLELVGEQNCAGIEFSVLNFGSVKDPSTRRKFFGANLHF
jgi:hypothetical protein